MALKNILREIYNPKKKFIPPTKEFLLSTEYEKMMVKHLPYENIYDIHEAQNKTQNFIYRHHQVNHNLCMFRWRGIQKHKSEILDLAAKVDANNIDFGGAACPLGFQTTVVDFLKTDAFGKTVPFKYLTDVPGEIDFLFSSHTLEHVPNLAENMELIKNKLAPEGVCIFHLPSFYCERWRVGTHTNKTYNDHCWTFGLKQDQLTKDKFQSYLEIDTFLETYFHIDLCEYCGDDSIYIRASHKR